MGCQQSHLRKIQHPQSSPEALTKGFYWRKDVPSPEGTIFIPVKRQKTTKAIPAMDKIEEVQLEKQKTQLSEQLIQSSSSLSQCSVSNKPEMSSIPTKSNIKRMNQWEGDTKGAGKNFRQVQVQHIERGMRNTRISLTERKQNVSWTQPQKLFRQMDENFNSRKGKGKSSSQKSQSKSVGKQNTPKLIEIA